MSAKTPKSDCDFFVEGTFTTDEVMIEVFKEDQKKVETVFNWGEILERLSSEIDFDYYLEGDEVNFLVEGKFTWDGISVSCYADDGKSETESWFTWSEVDERKQDRHPDFTYRLFE
jgi:hypothetical protein